MGKRVRSQFSTRHNPYGYLRRRCNRPGQDSLHLAGTLPEALLEPDKFLLINAYLDDYYEFYQDSPERAKEMREVSDRAFMQRSGITADELLKGRGMRQYLTVVDDQYYPKP